MRVSEGARRDGVLKAEAAGALEGNARYLKRMELSRGMLLHVIANLIATL